MATSEYISRVKGAGLLSSIGAGVLGGALYWLCGVILFGLVIFIIIRLQ